MAETLETIGEKLEALGNGFEALGNGFEALGNGFEALGAKVEALDTKVEALDTKVAALDAKVDKGFASVDERFGKLEKAVHDGDEKTRALLGVRIDGVSHEVKLIFERIDAIDQRHAEDAKKRAEVDHKLENHDLRILALENRAEPR